MNRREQNKLEKLARIREAAWALFRERGFEATTTKAIAEHAGIATGTLFLYARTKNELLLHLFRDELAAIIAERAATLPTDAALVDGFVHVCRGFYERYARDPELGHRFVHLVFAMDGSPVDALHALELDLIVAVAARVEAEKARGVLRSDVESPLLARNFFAIYGMNVLEFLRGGGGDVDSAIDVLRRSLRMLVDGTRA